MAASLIPQLALGQTGTGHINSLAAALAAKSSYTVAQLTTATAAANKGVTVYCSNGAAGLPCLAYSDGTVWHQIALGAAISAT